MILLSDVMQTSTRSKIILLALHFFPGIVFSIVLFIGMPFLLKSGLDLFLIQISLITIFLLGLEVLTAHLYCVKVEKRSFWSSLASANSIALNLKVIVVSVLWAALSVAIMKTYLRVANPFIQLIRESPLFALPEWHYQNLEMPNYPFKSILLTFMLGTNVFAEEMYFRGFLLERLRFLGRGAFLVNGTLFILYHVFQMRVAYPLLPFGLLLSGYYVIFRNVWGAMLIHLILNLSL